MTIRAECHSDDHVIKIDFDATAFFAQATDAEILYLANCGWGGDYPADDVALFFGDNSTAPLFEYIAICQRQAKGTRRESIGFECYVDEDDALAWINANKPSLNLPEATR